MSLSVFFSHVDLSELSQALMETLVMVGASTWMAVILGLPLGVLLVLSSKGHLCSQPVVHSVLGVVVNALRSTPFLILMILCMPLTKWVVGSSLGVQAAIVPLVIGAAPFFARLVEVSLLAVDAGTIDMGRSLGASNWQIVWHILLPEARVGIASGVMITAVALIGYSAMAGVVGGGGLGDLAIRHGYQQFETDVMVVTTLTLVVLVQILQSAGERFVRRMGQK
jgi:D-methionine transport system permease protein